jgi:hypothetical protein
MQPVRIYAHLNDSGRWSFRVEGDGRYADFSTLAEAEEAARALRGPTATWAPIAWAPGGQRAAIKARVLS